MRFRLSDESADAEGAIGDEETNEMSRKEPEDGELRVLVQDLRTCYVNSSSHKTCSSFFYSTDLNDVRFIRPSKIF